MPDVTAATAASPDRIDLTKRAGGAADVIAPPLLGAAAVFSGLVVALVVFFVFQHAWPLLSRQAVSFVSTGGWDQQLEEAWNSTGGHFGALPLIAGTLLTTLGALVLSSVLGMGCAVFLAELAPAWLRGPVETVVQLLAGIPSVVFGLVGISIVVPFITDHLVPANAADVVTDIPLEGSSLLAGIVVLSFMILPFFVSVAVDSLRAVPRPYLTGGMALGMTRWRAITRIQLPAAAPGLVAGLVLAAARGIGEAIALSMVAGAIAYTPTLAHGPLYFLLMPVRTMASAIVESGGEAMSIPSIDAALFSLAALLLALSLALSLAARWAFAILNSRTRVVTTRRV